MVWQSTTDVCSALSGQLSDAIKHAAGQITADEVLLNRKSHLRCNLSVRRHVLHKLHRILRRLISAQLDLRQCRGPYVRSRGSRAQEQERVLFLTRLSGESQDSRCCDTFQHIAKCNGISLACSIAAAART